MGPLWITVAAAMAASAVSSYMQGRQNRRNQKTGQAWEEQMRESKWQTTVQDMKDAGINPMVAYQQGAGGMSSSPAASGGADPELATSAINAMRATNEADLMKTQASVNTAMAAKTHEEEKLKKVDIKYREEELIKFRKSGTGWPANLKDTTEKALKHGAELWKEKAFAPGERAKIKRRKGENLRAFKYRREFEAMPKKWQRKHRKHRHSHNIQKGKEYR